MVKPTPSSFPAPSEFRFVRGLCLRLPERLFHSPRRQVSHLTDQSRNFDSNLMLNRTPSPLLEAITMPKCRKLGDLICRMKALILHA